MTKLDDDQIPKECIEAEERIRSKHPDKATLCGALLAEIDSTSASLEDRFWAAGLFALRAYKRGLRTLDRVASDVYADLSDKWVEDDWSTTHHERNLLSTVLDAIGGIDSPQSHAVLLRYLDSIDITLVRSFVITAMWREKDEFDADLVFSFLEEDANEHILESALATLTLHCLSIDAHALRSRVTPFLKHSSANVRHTAVDALMLDRGSIDAIKALSDDPESFIRDSVAYAIRHNEAVECESLINRFLEGRGPEDDVKTINQLIARGCSEDSELLFSDFANEPTKIQLSIVFSMRTLANEKARTILSKLLAGSSVEVPVRAALTEIVGDLGMTNCKKRIVGQLGHSAPEVRFWSCQTLGMIGQRDDLDRLRALLDDRAVGHLDKTVANAAEQAIEFIESK